MLDFNYPLLQLRNYIATVETFISSNIAQFPLSAERQEQLLKSPELELEFDVSYEEFIETVETFPEVLRRSTFLVSFILLETSLDRSVIICAESIPTQSLFMTYVVGELGEPRSM